MLLCKFTFINFGFRSYNIDNINKTIRYNNFNNLIIYTLKKYVRGIRLGSLISGKYLLKLLICLNYYHI